MPSNPDSRFEFRDVELSQIYDENYGREARHAAAKTRLKRWEIVAKYLLLGTDFNQVESQIIHFLLSGSKSYSEESVEDMAASLARLKQSVIDGLQDYAKQIDVGELEEKLLTLNLAQWIAVIDACDRVGKGAYHVENIGQELKRVGLI